MPPATTITTTAAVSTDYGMPLHEPLIQYPSLAWHMPQQQQHVQQQYIQQQQLQMDHTQRQLDLQCTIVQQLQLGGTASLFGQQLAHTTRLSNTRMVPTNTDLGSFEGGASIYTMNDIPNNAAMLRPPADTNTPMCNNNNNSDNNDNINNGAALCTHDAPVHGSNFVLVRDMVHHSEEQRQALEQQQQQYASNENLIMQTHTPETAAGAKQQYSDKLCYQYFYAILAHAAAPPCGQPTDQRTLRDVSSAAAAVIICFSDATAIVHSMYVAADTT
ncbi:hypothetical protein KI688_004560 [Linnemannia hyalina]|uniref:Uncharacterized protein n=1 Tax=Linnemannia hyalina TaxID=64524 RepID=A0A9P7XKI3_9FUNG|nr:hypothetical protein KI688_004560 [Linnemannia hyalina]